MKRISRSTFRAAPLNSPSPSESPFPKTLGDFMAEGPVEVEAARYETADDSEYALFGPLHYEPNYAYPLIIWLHGPHDDEGQLKRIMPLLSVRNFVGVAPRGTHALQTSDGRPRYSWSLDRGGVSQAAEQVFGVLERAEQRYHLAPGRRFLAGYDVGGTIALRIALEHPELFAGVCSIGGDFPAGRAPLARLADARRLPIFWACGRDSTRLPPERVCERLRLFHVAGMNVSLRQYPGGHQLHELMLRDANRWIMEQVTGTPADYSETSS